MIINIITMINFLEHYEGFEEVPYSEDSNKMFAP